MIASQQIPPTYLDGLGLLRWPDVAWGVEHNCLSLEDVVELALSRATESSSQAELVLAGLDPADAWAIRKALAELLTGSGEQSGESEVRWRFARLMHAYETSGGTPELLDVVEAVFCDFGHPSDMYAFVPYMPPEDGYDPTTHSLSANRQRLVTKLRDFLVETAEKLGARAPESRIFQDE